MVRDVTPVFAIDGLGQSFDGLANEDQKISLTLLNDFHPDKNFPRRSPGEALAMAGFIP